MPLSYNEDKKLDISRHFMVVKKMLYLEKQN